MIQMGKSNCHICVNLVVGEFALLNLVPSPCLAHSSSTDSRVNRFMRKHAFEVSE